MEITIIFDENPEKSSTELVIALHNKIRREELYLHFDHRNTKKKESTFRKLLRYVSTS